MQTLEQTRYLLPRTIHHQGLTINPLIDPTENQLIHFTDTPTPNTSHMMKESSGFRTPTRLKLIGFLSAQGNAFV